MRLVRSIRDWLTAHMSSNDSRRDLTVAALRCIAHGWPVLPGAWWSERANRHMCDIPGCLSAALHPAAIESNPVAPLIPPRNIADYALTRRREVMDRWSKHPYAVLVPTGVACDAIEIPSIYLERVLTATQSDYCGPVAQVGTTSYLFVSPTLTMSEPQLAELAEAHLLLHRRGSWVPIPPSISEGVHTEWIRRPTDVDWHLPAGEDIIPIVLSVIKNR